MKLLFKQRIFSWFDSYDIYSEAGEPVYTVRGQPAWVHCLKIFDRNGCEIGAVKERLFTILPKFEIYAGASYIGCISKELTFIKPRYNIDYNGWYVEGDLFQWNYTVLNSSGQPVAAVSKQILNLTDTSVIDVANPNDTLSALMLVIAIDAEKCSRGN